MDALLAARPSMFADIPISAPTVYNRHLDGLWFDVLEELVVV